jgi:hypothetical protein
MKESPVVCLKAKQGLEAPSSIAVTTTQSTIKQADTDDPLGAFKSFQSTRARTLLEAEEVCAGILSHVQDESDNAKGITRGLIDQYNISKGSEETSTSFNRDVPSKVPPAVTCSCDNCDGEMPSCRKDEKTLRATRTLSKATSQSYSSIPKQSSVGETEARENIAPPVRRPGMPHPLQAVTAPLLSLLLLGLFAPRRVEAALIPDNHGPHLTTSPSWPSNTTESFVLISSVVLFLGIAKRFLEGSGQQGYSVVPIWTVLTLVMPLSSFIFADLDLQPTLVMYLGRTHEIC